MENAQSPAQNQFDNKAQAWSARFSEPVSDLVKRYTASVDFDKRLALFDIQGSLAHADMLASVGVISAGDMSDIQRGMAQIRAEIIAGSFQWLLDLEDVHLNIEKRLVELVGDAGKRLHTGRSRNDQVATDIRLWLRDEIDGLIVLLGGLRQALASVALTHAGTIMPGFTHLQVAQPTCLRTPKCSAAMPHGSPIAASASMRCRSVQPRLREPASRSTANAWRAPLALTRSAAIRSTLYPTGISPSSSAPPVR